MEEELARVVLLSDGGHGGMHTVDLYRKARLACHDLMRESKFHKSRLTQLSASVRRELRCYR